MCPIEPEFENADREPALPHEVQTGNLLQEHKRLRSGLPARALLFATGCLIALGTRIKEWVGSAVSQGNLPNLHID